MDEVLQARSHPVDLLAEIEAVEETRDERAAIAIQRRAGSAGALAVELRAQLVLADIRDRRGEIPAAARMVRRIFGQAVELGDRPLLARVHRIMGRVRYELGDRAGWLEETAQAVACLDDDASSVTRGNILTDLANALAVNGDIEGARLRYHAADLAYLAAGRAMNRLTVLNNLAYSEHLAGEPERALAAAIELRDLAAAQRVPLHPTHIETIARAQLGVGRHAEAEETLKSLSPSLDFDQGDTLPVYLVTLAEVQRHRGRLQQAQANLDEAMRACDERELAETRARALAEQAELYAARGDYRQAFELHKTFHAQTAALLGRQRTAQALAQQAMFETTEARREARLFREQALHDPLTGLRNRRFVTDTLPAMIDDAGRTGCPLSVVMLDLDRFKRINDNLSYDAGDRVLVAVAKLLAAAVELPDGRDDGTGEFVARLGGEEFLLVLPGIGEADARLRVEALRSTIRGYDWRPIIGDLPVTASFGILTTTGNVRIEALMSEADRHLHAAKRNGRDRVVSAAVSLGSRDTTLTVPDD
ncbi:MAG: hypothetical protein AUI10_00680 [Actinobacteria bacterium 13_2_20CM_2_72_6]|nr:MAG: hypothetical protein AUI10_00680 [Actinobacteria bacterium 13_2_20CM_2_72_6]